MDLGDWPEEKGGSIMKRILVLGAGGPAAVNFIRSLRSAPDEFFIVGLDMNKYRIELPDLDKRFLVPENSDPRYVDILNRIIRRERIEMVHPQPDAEVKFLSDHREKIAARVFLPKKETVDRCQNKYATALIWKENDISVAASLMVENEEDVRKAAQALGLPFWMRALHGAGGKGSTPVENVEVGIHWLKYWRSRGKDWEFFAQEFLPGQNIAFTSVWDRGRIVSSQARERIEYIYPYLAPSSITGTPTVAKTISDDEVNEIAAAAVKAVDPEATGIFCVDLKRNHRRVPCPTEINAGRFFTTSYFFTQAGINLPFIYVKLAFEECVPPQKTFNAVEENQYWIRHIDSLPRLIKEGEWSSERAD
jgi:glutathione synthase/RimK-type ligase-like ATP-grasp enzyme